MDTATDDDLHDLDLASNITPFVDWDQLGDLEISSKSDDCLDEVFLCEPFGDALAKPEHERAPPVVLLSYSELSENRSDSDQEACHAPEDSDLDPDPGLDRDEVKYKRERGFYDVGMLNIDVVSLSNETLQRVISDNDHVNYLLHPDVKIEVLMAEQRKHMRIAQLLKLSQAPAEPPHPLQVVRPPDDSTQGDGKGMPVPPNTPRLAKLKPDHCWIKDIPDSPDVTTPGCDGNAGEPPLYLVTCDTGGGGPSTAHVSPESVPEKQFSCPLQQQLTTDSDSKNSTQVNFSHI